MASLRKERRRSEGPADPSAAAAPAPFVPPAGPLRLNIGSGTARLEGWVNIDIQHLPGVDVVADVTAGLQFSGAEAVFAEHFLEHLAFDAAVSFLLESHRVLEDGGWIRLSTPNLDWVWATHYSLDAPAPARRDAAVALNRAFHGWRHQFLWNREILEDVLAACGFAEVRAAAYGESELAVFRGIERHETYPDVDGLPHVLIVEARKDVPRPERLRELRERIERDYLVHLED